MIYLPTLLEGWGETYIDGTGLLIFFFFVFLEILTNDSSSDTIRRMGRDLHRWDRIIYLFFFFQETLTNPNDSSTVAIRRIGWVLHRWDRIIFFFSSIVKCFIFRRY